MSDDFLEIYDKTFPLEKMTLKTKQTDKIVLELQRDQKISKEAYKQYNNLPEKIEKTFKKLHYENKIRKSENNIKTTGKVIKQIKSSFS